MLTYALVIVLTSLVSGQVLERTLETSQPLDRDECHKLGGALVQTFSAKVIRDKQPVSISYRCDEQLWVKR